MRRGGLTAAGRKKFKRTEGANLKPGLQKLESEMTPSEMRRKAENRPEACPFNYLYWKFIDEHADRFGANPRMRMIVNSWLQRSASAKEAVRQSAREFLSGLLD